MRVRVKDSNGPMVPRSLIASGTVVTDDGVNPDSLTVALPLWQLIPNGSEWIVMPNARFDIVGRLPYLGDPHDSRYPFVALATGYEFTANVPMAPDNAFYMPWRTEYMSDLASKTSSQSFNDCVHYKIRQGYNTLQTNCSDIELIRPAPWNNGYMLSVFNDSVLRYHYLPLLAVARYELYANMPYFVFGMSEPEGIQAALDIAYSSIKPTTAQLTGDANLLLFLAELRDFREVAEIARLRGKTVERLASVLDFKNLTWNKLVKDLTHLGAEARLTMQYAIKPFISDVKALYAAFTSLDKRLVEWNRYAREGKSLSRHYDMTKYLPNAYPWPDSIVKGHSGRCNTRVVSTREFKCSATLRFKPLPFNMTHWNGLRKYHDAIGAGKFLSIAWELVPFSFLVDYVATVGPFVEQFDTALAELPISDQVLMYTSKWRVHQTAQASWQDPDGIMHRASCDGEYSNFLRKVVQVPDLDLEPWRRYRHEKLIVKVPGLEQLKNVVALILAHLT